MNRKQIIEKLKQIEKDKVDVEICFKDGLVYYSNIVAIKESDESILIEVKEIE